MRELASDPSDQYCAAPLEDNMFEWHFTIRGPPDTEFEGGCYHGRILVSNLCYIAFFLVSKFLFCISFVLFPRCAVVEYELII